MEIGCQVYIKGSAEAVELYMKAFGAELGYNVRNDDGSYYHAELSMDGRPMLAVSEAKSDIGIADKSKYTPECYPPMQFGVTLSGERDVAMAYDILKEGANILLPLGKLPWSDCCASLVDKFGVCWYLSVRQHRPDGDWQPER